jgi:hypothetical protein
MWVCADSATRTAFIAMLKMAFSLFATEWEGTPRETSHLALWLTHSSLVCTGN